MEHSDHKDIWRLTVNMSPRGKKAGKKTKSSSVKKCYTFLKLLAESGNQQRKRLLSIANTDQIKSLCEICLNTLKGTLPLNQTQVGKLKRHKTAIKLLAHKRTSLKAKKQVINQKGGFLGSLLSLALPLLSGLLGSTK